MKKLFTLLIVALLVGFMANKSVYATDCPSATVIPASPTMPYVVASLTCGTLNDMTSSNVVCGNSSYWGGLEAVYVWTPSQSYGDVTIAYSGQTYVGIFLMQGCPTSGGTCIANVTSSSSSKTLQYVGTNMTSGTKISVTAGVTYYIVFDTWPTPNSPCAGTFTLNGMLPCSGPTAQPTGATAAPVAYTSTAISGSFTASSPASSGYLVVRYPSGSAVTPPVNGTSYTVGGALGLGTVVQSSALTTFTATGLTPSTTYDFYIYSFSGITCAPIMYDLINTPAYTFATSNAIQSAPSTATGGLWSSPATWVSGVVPTGENAIIAAGAVVTVDAAVNVNGLTVNGTMQWGSSSYALTVKGDLVINSGGRFLPYSTSLNGQTVNVGGNLTNDGYANFAVVGSTTGTLLNFNGSTQSSSLAQVLGGSGIFQGDGTSGIIRALFFQTTGSSTISTTQNLIVTSDFAHTAGSLNTNGKLTINNTAQVFGQALNNQVANVVVTNMGAGYTTAPVVFGTAVMPWAATTALTLNSKYFFGNNVYLCTTAGTTSTVAPTTNSNVAFTDGTATLLYVGTLGTLGLPYTAGAFTTGNLYFYDNNLYLAVGTTNASGTTGPTHTTGLVNNLLWIGNPAKVSVNWDVTTSTVRSLTLVSAGSGYISAAPSLIFSNNGSTPTTSASATVVFIQQIAGPANSRTQKGNIATFTGGLNIVSDQAVGGITTSNGGVNYSAAPLVGFTLPNNINLVTAQGSGYTALPTVSVVAGTGTNIGGTTMPSFTAVCAGGKLVSVYCTSNGNALWTALPTLQVSLGGTATCAFPAGCLPTATVNLTNGSISSFTITNAGFGYDAAPSPGLVTVGTVGTAASTPTCRIGLYNLVYGYFAPATSAPSFTESVEIPANRRINTLNFAPQVVGTFTGNLELYASSPLPSGSPYLTASGLANFGSNTVTFSHRSYAGQTGSTTFAFSGNITLTSPGGSVTRSFPYDAGVVVVMGSGSSGTGSTITSITTSRIGAPTGTGNPIGMRTYRINTYGGVYGTSPSVTLNWNAYDFLISSNDSLRISQSAAQSGPWTPRSTFSGTGNIPVTGSRTTATATPGPINTDEYFAWTSGFVAPPALSFAIERNTGESYSSIMSTGNTFTWSGTSTDDNTTATVAMPAGSTFTYQGQLITGFNVCTNGWMKLISAASPATTATAYTNSFSSSGIEMIIAPFWDDLVTNPDDDNLATLNSHTRYEVFGTTVGSRQIVIEWFNYSVYNAAGPQLSWQVVLDETDNSVKINYGLFQGFNGTNNHAYSYSCGIGGRFVSGYPQPGEVLAQQYENTDAFSNNFVATANVGCNRLMSLPECNSSIKFTPGTYGGLIVPSPTPPANDDAVNAVEVPALTAFPSNLCGNFYTSRYATPSAQAVCAGDAGDDVWFKFTANEPLTTVRVYGSGGYKPSVQVFDDMLNLLPTPVCVTATGAGVSVDAALSNLSPSQMYYVRVYHNGGGIQASGTAAISSGLVTGSTMTNVGSGYTSTTSGAYTTARVRFVGGGGNDAVGYASLTGNTVGAVYMSNNGYGYTTPPTIEIESPSWAHIGEFAIVVYASAPNDDCATAVTLTGLATPGCNTGANSRTYNTLSATPSPEAAVCGTPDDDVWYKFVAVNSNTQITVSSTGTFNPAFQVFDDGGNASCGSKTSVACINVTGAGETENVIQPTIIGNTYWVRIYHADAGTSISGDFTICVSSAIPECITAPTYPLDAGAACIGPVTLSWPEVSGAINYDVYLNTGLGLVLVDSATTSLTYTTDTLAIGSYSWKVVPGNVFGDAVACSEWTFAIHNLPVPLVEPTAAGFCPNETPVQLQAGGAGAVTFEWLPVDGLDVTTGSIVHAGPGMTTVYTVTAADTYGCTATTIATITVNPIITATASADPVGICVGGSSVLSGTASVVSPYCVPVVTSYPGETGDYLNNFSFANITNNGSGESLSDYTYYSTMTANLVANGTTSYSISCESGGTSSLYAEYYGMWIDYNQNGIFETTEFVWQSTSSSYSPNITTGSITVPNTAFNGTTRMRIICEYGGVLSSESCTFDGFGEYEDYNVSITGGTTPPSGLVATYNWNPGGLIGSPVTATGITTTTTYTVTASAVGYCPGTAEVTVNVDPLVCNALTLSGATTCIGVQMVNSNVTGGGMPYTYSWTEDGLPFGGNTASITPSVGSHLYVCNVIDACANTCSSSDSVTTQGVPTLAVLPTTGTFCTPGGTPVLLEASGALGYDWTPASGLDTYAGSIVNASPSASVTYTVTGVDVYGCTASASATINVMSTINVTASAAPTSICLNDSSVLTVVSSVVPTLCIPAFSSTQASGDYIANVVIGPYSNPTGDSPNDYTYYNTITIPVVAGTAYPYTLIAGSSYTQQFSIWIDYNQNGVFDLSEQVFTTTSAVDTVTDSIVVPVTAYNGITRVRVASRYSSAIDASMSCLIPSSYGEFEDYNIDISGATNPPPPLVYTYTWNPGALSGTPVTVSSIAATTTYTVTASAAGYCDGVDSVTVTIEPLTCAPLTVAGVNNCFGKQTLTAHATGGGLPYNYSWTEDGQPFGTDTATIFTTPGTHTYVCTVSDACSNECSATTDIATDPNPVVAVTPNPATYCAPGGTAATLTASGADTYLWTPSTGLDFNNVAIVNATPAGTITYTITGKVNECTATTSVIVNVGPNYTMVPTAVPDSIPYMGSTQLYANVGSVLPSFYDFTVGTGATLDPMATADTVITSGEDDDPTTASAPIGFSFKYNGTIYTDYSVSPDGWILLGTTAAVDEYLNVTTSATNVPKIYPYWNDLATGTDGHVKVQMDGSAPDRVLKVEWFVTIPYSTSSAANSTFQAWLYEADGKIEFRYGTMGNPVVTPRANISAGLTGSPSGNFNSINFTSNTSSSAVATDTNNIAPASGTIFTYTPSVPSFEWTPATFLSSTTEMNPQVVDAYDSTTYTVTASYAGCSSPATVFVYVTRPDSTDLNLRVFIEGIFNTGTGFMNPALGLSGPEFPGYADQVTVELHDATAPYNVDPSLIFTSYANYNGYVSIKLPGSTYGFYYIVVKHRNSIETWSADPFDFTDPIPSITYDFTSAATQAFGANLKYTGGIYAIWSGDVTQDGVVDGSDLAGVDNAAASILLGYNPEDVNGDGVVDGSDLAMIDNNSAAVVQVWKP